MLHQAIQVSQFAKSAQPLHYIDWLHSVWPYSIFNHKKQTSPAFALLFKHPSALNVLKLACAGKQAHIRLVHISPQTQLPTKSNHRHWERFHTTLDILRHGQTQAQPQSQHTHTHTAQSTSCAHTHTNADEKTIFILPSWVKTLWMVICAKGYLRGVYFTNCFGQCLSPFVSLLPASANVWHDP